MRERGRGLEERETDVGRPETNIGERGARERASVSDVTTVQPKCRWEPSRRLGQAGESACHYSTAPLLDRLRCALLHWRHWAGHKDRPAGAPRRLTRCPTWTRSSKAASLAPGTLFQCEVPATVPFSTLPVFTLVLLVLLIVLLVLLIVHV